jgi:predicted double-glycine peptidase
VAVAHFLAIYGTNGNYVLVADSIYGYSTRALNSFPFVQRRRQLDSHLLHRKNQEGDIMQLTYPGAFQRCSDFASRAASRTANTGFRH